jgi:PAS domain S-box-containing protein
MRQEERCSDSDTVDLINGAVRFPRRSRSNPMPTMPAKRDRPWFAGRVPVWLVFSAVLATLVLAIWQLQAVAAGTDWHRSALIIGMPMLLAIGLILRQGQQQHADETALRQSEFLRRRACHMARLCHWRVNLKGDPMASQGIDDYSGEVSEIFGVEPEQLKTGGREYYRTFVHPDDVKHAERVFTDFLTNLDQSTYVTEYRIRHTDGTYRVIREMAEKVLDDDGTAIEAIGTIQDVTDWRQAVEQLAVAEGQLAIAHRLANLGFWYWQPPAPGLQHDLGYYYSPELRKILRRNVSTRAYSDSNYTEDFVHPDDQIRVLGILKDYHDGKIDNYNIEYRAIPSDGKVVFLRSIAERRRDVEGQPAFALGIIQDITSLKETALNLEMTLQQLSYAHRLANLGFWRWQPDFNELAKTDGDADLLPGHYSYSMAHLDLLGVTEEDFRHRSKEDYCTRYVHPDDRDRMREIYRRWDRGEVDDFTTDYRFLRPDGRQISIYAVGHRARDEFGKPTFGIGLFQDVTEAKEREAMLMEALARAEAANHTKTQFLAHMSHELRTPLNAAIGFADTMAMGLLGPVPEAYGGYAEAIGSSGRHLLTAIDEILMASHLELGESKLEEVVLHLDEIVATTVQGLTPDATAAGIDIDMAQARQPLQISGDGQALRLTLRHVLSHAITTTPSGGKVKLAYGIQQEEDGTLWLDLSIGDGSVDLATADQPQAKVSYPIGHAYLASTRGVQFGLDIARRFMELHDGHLIIIRKTETEEIAVETTGMAVILRLPANRLRDVPQRKQPVSP